MTVHPETRIISLPEWSDCLGRLREARALILRDAESFHDAASVLEHVGQSLCGRIHSGLGGYEDALVKLATSSGQHEVAEISRLFGVVKDARNMAVHEGAWARHLNGRLVDLFLVLEESIMDRMPRVGDIMVRSPVLAEPWHMLAHIRRAMLANSFSCLPIHADGTWKLVCDTSVMRWLRCPPKAERKMRLATRLESAIAAGEIELSDAVCFTPEATIEEVVKVITHLPVLVVQEVCSERRLVGLVTPFDLL